MPESAEGHLAELRSRLPVPLGGDVCQRGAPNGIYEDGWTNGNLNFSIEPARDISDVSVDGILPESLPPGGLLNLSVGGSMVGSIEAEPGPFHLSCKVKLRAGRLVPVDIHTTATVFDATRNRRVGAHLSAVRLLSCAPAPFICNLCGTPVRDLAADIDPEGSLCQFCRCNIRQRALGHLVSDALFGEERPLTRFGAAPGLVGLGISDSPAFAELLKAVVPGYVNTQFDSALLAGSTPFLDIKNPDSSLLASADFVTCSEVFEHVAPPLKPAFDGLLSILRPGGTLIFTAPYSSEPTVEHFPDLYEWKIVSHGDTRVLVNRTRDGQIERFDRLRFHGGGDAVLEMRVLGLEDIIAYLRASGFTNIRVREENVLSHGVFFRYNWGLPITAQRPIIGNSLEVA